MLTAPRVKGNGCLLKNAVGNLSAGHRTLLSLRRKHQPPSLQHRPQAHGPGPGRAAAPVRLHRSGQSSLRRGFRFRPPGSLRRLCLLRRQAGPRHQSTGPGGHHRPVRAERSPGRLHFQRHSQEPHQLRLRLRLWLWLRLRKIRQEKQFLQVSDISLNRYVRAHNAVNPPRDRKSGEDFYILYRCARPVRQTGIWRIRSLRLLAFFPMSTHRTQWLSLLAKTMLLSPLKNH